jgi:hypothetical protein
MTMTCTKARPDSRKGEGSVKLTPVMAATTLYSVSGNICRERCERLLDVLNEGSRTDRTRLPADFIQLSNAEVISLDGQNKTYCENCMVSKERILFIAEKCKSEAVAAAPSVARALLFQPKKALPVEIVLPGITIRGLIHIDQWQEPAEAFKAEERFLALTNVRLVSRLPSGETEFDFAAINRSQIILLVELPGL